MRGMKHSWLPCFSRVSRLALCPAMYPRETFEGQSMCPALPPLKTSTKNVCIAPILLSSLTALVHF